MDNIEDIVSAEHLSYVEFNPDFAERTLTLEKILAELNLEVADKEYELRVLRRAGNSDAALESRLDFIEHRRKVIKLIILEREATALRRRIREKFGSVFPKFAGA